MEGKEFCSIIIISLLIGEIDSMTRQQIKNAAKIVKRNCMNKNNVTEDLIGDIEKGKFIEERPVMCYIACVYKTTQIVKNNKINYEASLKQVQINYPDDMKEGMLISIENCKGLLKKYKDLCESAYWTAKCIYEDNPKNFLFP
ncbi:general odorant-binding protein 72 [Pieris rapae]|uniref:general odorant-binding protein 72 n=1 Tax=Pieris rapae TaxID=64459 RepID=UPI001E27EEA2|nr:general odorant-binding protein 72 [Pieris rapae]